MLVNLDDRIIEILKEWNKIRKTQDNFATNMPVYIVQSREERVIDESYDSMDIQRLDIPEISSEDNFYPTIEDIKNGALRDTELPCNLVMELEQKENLEQVVEEIQNYFNPDDKYYDSSYMNLQYYWENQAYFLVLEEAERYQEYQRHNLGVSRIYADYVGYGNKGTLSEFLRLIDDKNIFLDNKESD